MKYPIRSILTFASMLFASVALAGIIFVPVGGRYDHSELAPTVVQLLSGETSRFRIRTRDLNGALELDCSEVPGCRAVERTCADIPFSQQLELVVDRETGDIAGRTLGKLDLAGTFDFTARVRGEGTCLPFAGRACGQLVVDLEARGPFSDPGDASRVGLIRMHMVGSLLRDGDSSRWAALSASNTLGFALPDGVAELLSAKCKQDR
jgi:hypothetical protein